MPDESASNPPEAKKTILIAALLAAVAFALFSPVLGYGFLNYDDNAYVYENSQVQKGLSGSGVQYAFTTRDIGTWAPLTWVSYEWDTTVLGPRARSYHLTNILLHAAAGAFLFVALQGMLKSLWVSVTVALLFLIHPLRTESVAWIAERKDVLCAFFWMLGLLAYGRYAEKPNGRRWALVFLCFLAGLMSKMMMVTFPFVLLLLDFWPLNRTSFATEWRKRIVPLILEKVPFFVGSVLSVWVTRAALSTRGALNEATPNRFADLLRVPENYVFYLGKIFWPAHLSVLYPLESVQNATAILCALLLVAITVLAVWQWRKMPWLAVGWLWFLGVLVPVIGFVPFGDFVVADRYTYIPSVGLALAVVVAVEKLFQRFPLGRWVAAGAVALACGLATGLDLPRWRNSDALFKSALQVGPHFVAYNNRGAALLNSGQPAAALENFNAAIRLKPTFAEAYNNRGKILSDVGRYEEAMWNFDKAIEHDPSLAHAYDNRGNVYVRTGKAEKALAEYSQGMKIRPDFAVYYNDRAAAYFQLKRFSEAAADIETCQRLGGQPHPGLVQALAEATKSKP